MIQNQLTRVEDFITPNTNLSRHLEDTKKPTHLRCEGNARTRITFTPKVYEIISPCQILKQVKCAQIAKTNYTIVRPLIDCSRRRITMASVLSKLPVYPDLTNAKIRYSRNRLRKQIIPSLQFFFNPQVEKALFKFSEFSKL